MPKQSGAAVNAFARRLGESIRLAIEQDGRSVEDIARMAPVDVGGLYGLMRGERTPNVGTLRRLARVLKIKAWVLLKRAEGK